MTIAGLQAINHPPTPVRNILSIVFTHVSGSDQTIVAVFAVNYEPVSGELPCYTGIYREFWLFWHIFMKSALERRVFTVTYARILYNNYQGIILAKQGNQIPY